MRRVAELGSLGVMKVAAILCASGLLAMSSGCASRKITTVSLPYATVTNKVALMRPAPGASGIVFSRETEPGAQFTRWMREPGGGVKRTAWEPGRPTSFF